jgi:argininosuccinate synthase
MAEEDDAPRISAHQIPPPEAKERLRAQATASYEASPDEVNRVLLLYSGGLDTSVMLKWIQDEYEAEVVTLTVNLGQPGEDYEVVEGKARRLGAVETFVVDAREEFAHDFVAPAIKANAIYGLAYPLFTALGRPLIAKLAVEYARRSGCDTIAHGCTGKGNDQVRIEATVATLAPELKLIAPVRSWSMGRDEEIAYAREHGIPVKGGTEAAPYSIDDNLWGRSSEGKWIEDLAHEPEDDVFQLVTRPEEAPDEAQVVRVEFERGLPVAVDGERMELVALLERVAEIGQRHGVGIVDHIEDRIVGLKVRDIYEVPAAAIILTAHAELEKLVGTIHQNQFKPQLDRQWGYLVYAGLWWEPLRENLDAYMESVNDWVSGTIGLKLYKGSVRVVSRESEHAVYDAQLATFAESGGLFSQQASPGFIELWSLQSRLAWRLRAERSDGG